jgi:hypothetical protein
LMLDEPTLIVRMRGLVDFMDDSFAILQSGGSQFRARGAAICVKNASNPQLIPSVAFDGLVLEPAVWR